MGRSAPARGRKSVTVLFADIVNSSALVRSRDPEHAFEVLRPIIDLMAASLERYGGTVGDIAGDNVMGVFGAPLAQEDHALAACCAALAMRDDIAAARPGQALRIGIMSGEVVIHAIDLPPRSTIEATGEAVYLAKRLEAKAAPGEIWIGAPTAAMTAGRVVTRPLGAMSFDGFPEPVTVFALEAADPSITRLDAPAARKLAPFVGRATERASLAAAADAVRAGSGRAVALVGEAGTGKSRLMHEFAAGPGLALTLQTTRCIRWHENVGFHPLRPLIRRILGIGDAMPELAGMDTAAIAALLDLPQPDRTWAATDPVKRGRRMIAAATEALLAAAREGPAAILVDDLHWSDPETDSVLTAVLDRLGEVPLMLLLGWRPDRAPALAAHAAVAALPVLPLPEEEAEQLAARLLGDGAAEAARRIAERSGGNPLFVEEEVQALREPPRMEGGKAVPPTVRSLLAARIDRLDDASKAVLEALAVLGEPSGEETIWMVTGMAKESVPQAAAILAAAGLARGEGIGPAARWACRHALYQDVAYIGMTFSRRRALHGVAAAALAESGGAGPETIARHARTGEAWELAVTHGREAGRRAAARNANRAAIGFFTEALDALDHLPESKEALALAVDLRFELRNPLHRLGRIAELRARLDEAGAPADKLGDASRLGQLHINTALHAWLAGAYQDALAAAARATALAEATGDAALALRATFQRGLAHVGMCAFDRAAEEMAEVAARAEDADVTGRYGLDAALAATALSYRVRALADAERFEEAEEALVGAKSLIVVNDRPFHMIFVLIAEGFLLWRRGDADQARAPLREAVALCDVVEADLMRPVALAFLGAAEAACGQCEEGISMLERAVALAAEMGFLFQQDVRRAFLVNARSLRPGAQERSHA
jgi:class 3 adenylate cyclase